MQLIHKINYKWVFVLWTVLICVLLFSPSSGEPGWLNKLPGADKLAHLLIFSLWSFAMSLAFNLNQFKDFIKLLLPIVFGLSFAALTEYVQNFIPGRQGDLFDFIFDATGIAIGILITFNLKKRTK